MLHEYSIQLAKIVRIVTIQTLLKFYVYLPWHMNMVQIPDMWFSIANWMFLIPVKKQCVEKVTLRFLGLYFLNSCKCYKKSDMVFRIYWVLEVVMVQLVFQTANYVLETVSFTVISWKGVGTPPQLWLTARTILNCRCLCCSCQTQLNKHLFTFSPENRSRSCTQMLWSIMTA